MTPPFLADFTTGSCLTDSLPHWSALPPASSRGIGRARALVGSHPPTNNRSSSQGDIASAKRLSEQRMVRAARTSHFGGSLLRGWFFQEKESLGSHRKDQETRRRQGMALPASLILKTYAIWKDIFLGTCSKRNSISNHSPVGPFGRKQHSFDWRDECCSAKHRIRFCSISIRFW